MLLEDTASARTVRKRGGEMRRQQLLWVWQRASLTGREAGWCAPATHPAMPHLLLTHADQAGTLDGAVLCVHCTGVMVWKSGGVGGRSEREREPGVVAGGAGTLQQHPPTYLTTSSAHQRQAGDHENAEASHGSWVGLERWVEIGEAG